jgi:NAD(P)-dependent dehydrogenase (short-subunit alcohol dehydrogenase family)
MEVRAQQGRTALVTGANSGIGYETALALARAGARVLVAGRDQTRIEEAAARIEAAVPDADVDVVRVNLASLDSVEEAAAAVLAGERPLDVLVNNAGVMAIPRRRTTKDGHELTFGTNHLGHFALTGRLLPALLRAESPRVVTVSSVAARSRSATLDDLQSEHGYRPMQAYARSKLANLVFTQELARRAAGTPLVAVAAHPGTSATRLQRNGSFVARALAPVVLGRLVGHTPDRAAKSPVYAATAPDVEPGAFVGPTGRREGRGEPGRVPLPSAAADPAAGRALWELSERLTGVAYAWPARAG